jgi:hypothetical protein
MNDETELCMMLLYCWRTQQRRTPGITSGSRLYYRNDVNSTCKLMVNINIDSDYWRGLNITGTVVTFYNEKCFSEKGIFRLVQLLLNDSQVPLLAIIEIHHLYPFIQKIQRQRTGALRYDFYNIVNSLINISVVLVFNFV